MINFKFADVAEGLEEGKVLEVFVKEGDSVKDGQNLFSVETDKVNTEIPSSANGIIKKIYIKPGQEIRVGEVVMDIDDGKGAAPVADSKTASQKTESPKATAESDDDKTASVIGAIEVSNGLIAKRTLPVEQDKSSDNDYRATPLARKMAQEKNIDLSKVTGSGPNGRILLADLETSQAATKSTEMTSGVSTRPIAININSGNLVERVPMTGIRKAIAKQMMLSKTMIPDTTLIKHVNVTELINLRAQLKPQAEKMKVKLSFMPFFIKACAIALQEFPMINATIDESTNDIIYKKYYNIGMAVDSPSGLMVPVIKTADQLSILQIASLVNELASKVRDRKISPAEMKDSTFTISNFGSVGVEFATPVINYPEVAILGVGTIEKKPVVKSDNTVGVGSILPLSLSIDHRLIDGADGGRFLTLLAELLTNPVNILL